MVNLALKQLVQLYAVCSEINDTWKSLDREEDEYFITSTIV